MANWDILTPVVKNITPDTSAYQSGDVVGGLLTLAMPTTRGFITGLHIAVGEASKALAGTMYIYNATPSTFADNEVWLPVHADNQKQIGEMLMPTALSQNSFNVYSLKFGGGSTLGLIEYATSTLYAYYVTTSAPTFGASKDVTFTFHVLGQK